MLKFSDYPLDPHKTVTEDGYILTLFRLRTGRETDSSTLNRPPVLFLHGLLGAGTEWLCPEPDKSLPYLLSDEGYDCWIACQRGTRLNGPEAHVKYSRKEKQFWDFSVDEYGYYDIPAMIDYVLKVTNQENLFYVGHSLGTSGLFLTLAVKPEYNSKIKVMAALTPAVYGDHCSIKVVTKVVAPLLVSLAKHKFAYRRSVMPKTNETYVKKWLPCIPKSFTSRFCASLMGFSMRRLCRVSSRGQLPICEGHLSYLAKELPGGSSMKTIIHCMQAYSTGSVTKYDYGHYGNQKAYGQPQPPPYDLQNITAPIAMFTSSHDYLIPAQDVLRLSKELKNVIFYKCIEDVKLGHVDLVMGKDAPKLVFEDVIKIFNEYKK